MQVKRIVLVAAVLMSGPVTASDKTDVMSVAQRFTEGFNKDDQTAVNVLCAPDAVIIDDFPPHVWRGPGACSQWLQDFRVLAAKMTITEARIALGTTRHLDVELDYAYLVIPTILAFRKAGAPVKDNGIVVMTLHKFERGWRITGWVWTDQ